MIGFIKGSISQKPRRFSGGMFMKGLKFWRMNIFKSNKTEKNCLQFVLNKERFQVIIYWYMRITGCY